MARLQMRKRDRQREWEKRAGFVTGRGEEGVFEKVKQKFPNSSRDGSEGMNTERTIEKKGVQVETNQWNS
jgi:hypothetical protein